MKEKRLIPEVRIEVERTLKDWVTLRIPDCTFESLADLTTNTLRYLKLSGHKLKKTEKEHITHHIDEILGIFGKEAKKCLEIVDRK